MKDLKIKLSKKFAKAKKVLTILFIILAILAFVNLGFTIVNFVNNHSFSCSLKEVNHIVSPLPEK